MRNYLIALGLMPVAGFAFVAPIDGKWVGDFQGMNISYIFKADGDKLTGATTSPDGKEIAIKDGKINGNNISFSIFEMPIDITGNRQNEPK